MSSNLPDPQQQYLDELKAFFADPNNQQQIQRMFSALPEQMQSWLTDLCLLYGVPFHNLVIDDRMLPPESIRFFYIDRNWIEALVDGVFSVGVHSSRNTSLIQIVIQAIRKALDYRVPLVRNNLRGLPPPNQVMTG